MPRPHNQNGGGKHVQRWACGDYADSMDVDDETIAEDQRRQQGQKDRNELVISETIDLTDDTRRYKRAALPSSAPTTTANAKKRTFSMTEDDDAPVAAQARIKRPQLAADPKTSGPDGMRNQEGGTAAPQIEGRHAGALRFPTDPWGRHRFWETVRAFQDNDAESQDPAVRGLEKAKRALMSARR